MNIILYTNLYPKTLLLHRFTSDHTVRTINLMPQTNLYPDYRWETPFFLNYKARTINTKLYKNLYPITSKQVSNTTLLQIIKLKYL